MSGKLKIFVTIFFLTLFVNCFANSEREYNAIHYNELNGLPSNLTKKIKCDDSGFIWIATDSGLIRYDGNEFVVLNHILPSTYVKDIVFDKEGGVYVVSDFGFGKLSNPRGKRGEITYEVILEGGIQPDGEKLYYPKAGYFDSRGVLWISSLTSITRITDGNQKKIPIEKRYHPDSYHDSFILQETSDGELFCVSWKGFLLKYDPVTELFNEVVIPGIKDHNINDFIISRDQFFLATNQGYYEITGIGTGNPVMELLVRLSGVSTIFELQDKNLLLGTWNNGLHWYSRSTGELSLVDVDNLIRVISVTSDKYGGIWAASENGVFLLNEALFKVIDFTQNQDIDDSPFIFKSVLKDINTIVFTDQLEVFKLDIDTYECEKINSPIREPIYDFDANGDYLGISYRTGELYFSDGNNVVRKYFKNDRLTDINIDTEGNLWALLEQSGKVYRLTPEGSTKIYEYKYDTTMTITLVKVLGSEVLIGMTGKSNRIAKYLTLTDEFVPFGTDISSGGRYQLSIFDIEKNNDHYYLATNLSLLELHQDSVFRNPWMESIESPNVRAIAKGKKEELWLGTDRGIYLVSEDGTSHFNQNDGLPNSTITIQGLIVDKYNRLWASTPEGLAVSIGDIFVGRETPPPILREKNFYDSGNHLIKTGTPEYLAGCDFHVKYSSLFFPTEDITYQYRLIGEDDDWSLITTATLVKYNNLAANDYTFLLRAKKDGYKWSEPVRYPFFVITPWYKKPGMLIVYFFSGILGAIVIVIYWNRRKVEILNEQRHQLEILVQQRTSDLEEEKHRVEHYLAESVKTGKELRKLNEFKGELLSVASHDLKNPLQSILGMEPILMEDNELTGESEEAANIIFEAAKNMLNIITEILDNALTNASELTLKKEIINFSEIVQGAITQNSILAERKEQILNLDIEPEIRLEVDKVWMRNVIDNLLSNAIKYSPYGKNIRINLKRENSHVVFKIKDEGPGFTKTDLEKVFNKFQRLSAQPTGNEPSTGLGLFIVKEIVTLHGGTIQLESEPGKGAEFIITL